MRRQVLVVVVAALAVSANLIAKGPTVRLEITGGALSTPITITNAEILSESNVFHDQFLGPIARPGAIDRTWPRYAVSFFVELPAWMRQGIQKKYVVYYAKDPQTGSGLSTFPLRAKRGTA